MICPACRRAQHRECPEVARQSDPSLTLAELAASARCDCQHQPCGAMP